jgi:hypothetical protein
MIEKIDSKIKVLLKYKDADEIVKLPELRVSVCTLIEKAYFLESLILLNKPFSERSGNQFFTAQSAVKRHYKDWGLDEVADIYDDFALLPKFI